MTGPASPPGAVIDVSVVCAVYNEGRGVETFVEQARQALVATTASFELVLVDDGSDDDTLERLKRLTLDYSELRVVELARNAGQVAALGAGLTVARGALLVTMDGDLQHDPADIPRLLKAAHRRHDLVATYRERRADPRRRRLVTWVGNRVNRLLTGLDIRDFGSTFRVIDRGIIEALKDDRGYVYFNTPALYAAARRPVQLPITQHRRPFGESKWTLPMFVAYNLDFVTASPRLTHLALGISGVGLLLGVSLYSLKLLAVFAHVEAISAPASIIIGSLQLGLLAAVWREVIQAQRFAKGMRPFVIRRLWPDSVSSPGLTSVAPPAEAAQLAGGRL